MSKTENEIYNEAIEDVRKTVKICPHQDFKNLLDNLKKPVPSEDLTDVELNDLYLLFSKADKDSFEFRMAAELLRRRKEAQDAHDFLDKRTAPKADNLGCSLSITGRWLGMLHEIKDIKTAFDTVTEVAHEHEWIPGGSVDSLKCPSPGSVASYRCKCSAVKIEYITEPK